ncbi:MAG: hypothetical protein JJE51_03930 [Thermoanaerobaculia bacterium]|nr:hypothetical protein [Thermoanaerobaculia bacterium]
MTGVLSGFSHHVLTLLSLPVSLIFRATPRTYRFHVARLFARLSWRVYRVVVYSNRRPPFLDGSREDVFRVMLRIMDRLGVVFDPVLTVRGAELVPPGAAVFLSGHFMLNSLWARWVVDSGHRLAIIATNTETRLLGTPRKSDILSGPAVLVAARSRLLSGCKVHCAVDTGDERPEWQRIETAEGTRWISDAMPRLAERLRVPVLFVCTRVDRNWNVVVTIEKASSVETEAVTHEFRSFFLGQLAQMQR